MKVEHTPLLNEFVSFWFETFVDGVFWYETFIDFVRSEWVTCTVEGAIVLRGRADDSMSEYVMIDDIKREVEADIQRGLIESPDFSQPPLEIEIGPIEADRSPIDRADFNKPARVPPLEPPLP